MNLEPGRILMIAGAVLIVVGALISFKIPFLGKLPGDISIKRDNFQFYFPLATCILLSIVLTVLLRLFRK